MKDFRHLFGGFVGGALLLALYLLAWGCLQHCMGAECKCLHADCKCVGDCKCPPPVFVAENGGGGLYIPKSGERVQIGDFEFVLISSGDWTRWTNAVGRLEAVAERRWRKEHSTEAGRVAWHGKKIKAEQTEDGKRKVSTYEDGFVWTEEAKPERRVSPAVRAIKAAARATPAPAANVMPSRLRALQEARKAAREQKPKELNVTFGAGGKVLKSEEAK